MLKNALISLLFLSINWNTKTASAALIFSFAGGSTNQLITQAANQQLNFFIGSSNSDSIVIAVSDVVFSSPVSITGSQIGATSGDNGYFASGNLNLSQITALNTGNGVNVNQELTSAETLSGPSQLWFTLSLDASVLAEGTYDIDFDTSDGGFFNAASSALGFNNNLSMTVTAVPEPSTTLLLFGAGAVGIAIKRRRRLPRVIYS